MKRSMGQGLPVQGTSSKMTRHDPEDVEETPKPTTNIFLVETVVRRLFKQIESVTMLKDLRGMCQLWDRLDTEELEERAFQGRFKPINLTISKKLSGKFQLIKYRNLEMREFFDDTSSNPGLFRSFIIAFPDSLVLLNLDTFRCFYTDYSPTYLELVFPDNFECNQDKEGLLKELLRWAAPTLKELVFNDTYTDSESDQIPSRKSLAVQSFNFPHLRKVSARINRDTVEPFKVIFTKENHPETPSLTTLSLRCKFPVDLLDLNSNPSRWATLAKLDIFYGHTFCGSDDGSNNYKRFNEFTGGLLSLARAGMTLKKLDLGLRFEKEPWDDEVDPHFLETCRNLSQFFASQAGSLEALKLTFNLCLNVSFEEDQRGEMNIRFPFFERLHTLSLDLDTHVCNTYTKLSNQIVEIGSISQHFPALENLNILHLIGLINPFSGVPYEEESERMNLKWIKIPYEIYSGNDLDLSKIFGSVEAFGCLQSALNDLRILGDLVDTIRVLHIRDVNSELDLSRFKGLRKVVIEENDKARRIYNKKLDLHEGDYLSYFKKVAELGLDSIMFRGLEMIEGQSYKEFAEAFPFRVGFEDKPVDWIDQDFINN